MNTDTSQEIKRKNILILFFAILILMLNIFLPTVLIKTGVNNEKDQYLNYESMKTIEDAAINSLLVGINQIILIMWSIIVVSFVSFLGLILRTSEKMKRMSNLLMLSGCATLALSITACLFSLFFLMKVNDTKGVFSSGIYLTLLLLALLTIITLSFTISILKYSLEEYKQHKKVKNKIPEKIKKQDKKKVKKADLEKEKSDKFVDKKIKFKMEDWDNKRTKPLDFSEEDVEEKEEILEPEIEKKPLEAEEKLFEENEEEPEPEIEEKPLEIEEKPQEESSGGPFIREKEKEDESKGEITEKTNVFEKALESAINKKKMGISQKPAEPLQDAEKKSISESKEQLKEEIEKEFGKQAPEKFNVKCPKCSFIFEAEKQPDGITKIKCPKCGKEGIIK